jgi:L-aminopeptidase/D-esterase-like protein
MVQQGEGNDVLTAPAGNTTLTVVVTNLGLADQSLRQLARQVHGSMSRAIEPFHALRDGDVLYAVSTGEIEDASLGEEWLAITASELAWDAVLSSSPSNDVSAPVPVGGP